MFPLLKSCLRQCKTYNWRSFKKNEIESTELQMGVSSRKAEIESTEFQKEDGWNLKAHRNPGMTTPRWRIGQKED